ncbi:hypothetical protein [Streptomyces sp. 2A115]|uniref:hypothetical protein n=1 Tax=Streptomyces sp. 2A115 TaxID=3457439 RepID=UPI003FD58759
MTAKPSEAHETYETWAARLELRLALQPDMHRAAIVEVLAETAEYCTETDEHPRDAFGDPDEYAVQVARERDPVGERAGRDWAGLRPADYLTKGIYGGAVLLMVGAGLALARGEWWVNLTLASVAGSILVVAATLASGPVLALHAEGRPKAAAAVTAGTLVLVVVGAVAFLGLPRDHIGRLPAWIFAACGALLALLAWRLESSTDSRRKTATARAQEADRTESAIPVGADASDAERWLRHLGDLLSGRHRLPRRRVRQLVAEARDHLAATGHTPAEEFGPVEVYALELAEHAGPRVWWTRESGQLALSGGLFTIWGLDRLVNGDFGWAFWLCAAALTMTLSLLAARIVKNRS